MRNDKIIDLNTFKVLDENSGYIIVDSLIADTIAILNKKGYKTLYCCSGHTSALGDCYKQVCDISLLNKEQLKKDYPGSYIVDINEKDFTFITSKEQTLIYIKFAKDYHFSTIPEGFKLAPVWDDVSNDWSKTDFDTIEAHIKYFENGILCNPNEIQEKINKYNKILNEWARSLPYINERDDINE